MIWAWAIFIGFVLLMLALDLGVFHRKARVVTVREALIWTAVWITLGTAFSVIIYFGYAGQWFGLGTGADPVDGLPLNDGGIAAEKYLTGYVIEKSLSVDNIFVIAMVFASFAVPTIYQHRVLFWGILGALSLRGLMIGLGARLIAEFHWVLYLFGGFLILTAIKMFFAKTKRTDPGKNPIVRLVRRFFPVTSRFYGERFFVRAGTASSQTPDTAGASTLSDEAVEKASPGTIFLTPLALALVMVETMDLIFAVDSIPAIFSVTADPFLVFTSNAFAVLGLRSLYFALAGMMERFRYLKVSLALVLLLIGVKMLVTDWLKAVLGQHYNVYLLGLVLLILGAGVAASAIAKRQGAHGGG
jgi:tellurite resistance protein TerC